MSRGPKFALENVLGAPHTGEMLTRYFKARRTYKSALARLMKRAPGTVAAYRDRPSIQTTILWELCNHLKHNFFADIAAQLPVEFTTEAVPDKSKDEEIARLEDELRVVRAERDVLRGVLERR